MRRCIDCDEILAGEARPCGRCPDDAPARCRGCSGGVGGFCPVCGEGESESDCEAHAGSSVLGACVLCGKPLCARCAGKRTTPYLCDEHGSVPIIGAWAQVYSTTGEFEAQLLRENLQAEGLEAEIFSQKDHIYPVDLGELSIVRIMVPLWRFGTARETIREHMDTRGEVVFACPACGEAFEPGADACTSCGSMLT